MNTNKINIFISGDFAPNLRVSKLIFNREYEKLFNDILPIIQNSDLAITNLEVPLIDKGIPIDKTGPNLKASPLSIGALKFAGFNLVTLANNHIMDYGEDGLTTTIKACLDNDIEVIGAGKDYNHASEIKYKVLSGKRISFINITENEWSTTQGDYPGANPLDIINQYYQISEAKRNSDYLILIIHGGHEHYDLPSPLMKKLYRFFIDLGADAVIGHHTHCFSGFEFYNDKPIVYGLGNFIFDRFNRNYSSSWHRGCAISLLIEESKINLEFYPYSQCTEKIGIQLFDEIAKSEFLAEVIEKEKIIKSDDLLNEKFKNFKLTQTKKYQFYLEPFQSKFIYFAIKRNIFPRFIKGKKRLLLLNLIRCESHRELVMSILNENK